MKRYKSLNEDKKQKVGEVYVNEHNYHFYIKNIYHSTSTGMKMYRAICIEDFINALKRPILIQKETFNRSFNIFDFDDLKLVRNYKLPDSFDEYLELGSYDFYNRYFKK